MCWLTCPRIPMRSSRRQSSGLSSIGNSTAGNGRHQPFSFPTLCFCRCSMLGTYHSLIGRGGDGLRESWLLATTEASVSRTKRNKYPVQHVAGSWFIWFLRSVSFVSFDEQERQDRPLYQIDCPEFAVLRFAIHDADAISLGSFIFFSFYS